MTDLDNPGTDYYRERTKQMRQAGLDPDDDDVWAMPDYAINMEET